MVPYNNRFESDKQPRGSKIGKSFGRSLAAWLLAAQAPRWLKEMNMKRNVLIMIAILAMVGSSWATDYLDPHDLRVGSAYIVSRRTPLMPEVEPADPMAALSKMKQIPVGGVFKIYGIHMKNGKPWYRVRALTANKKQIGSGFINSAALFGQTLRPYVEPPNQAVHKNSQPKLAVRVYRITSSKELDYRNRKTMHLIRRKEYRVHLKKDVSQAELRAIAEDVIAQAPPVDAVVVFFYLPESEPTGVYTAGKATYAPNGRWEDAGIAGPKRLVMQYGGVLGTISKKNRVDLPLSKKKAIFMTLARYQDQGMDVDQSYVATAKRYGITKVQVRKIMIEGVVKNWPKP